MQHKTQSWAGPIIFMLQKNGWQTKQKRSKIIEKKEGKHTHTGCCYRTEPADGAIQC